MRHLFFSGLKPGETTWMYYGPYRSVRTIGPGERIPLGEFEWPQHYVNMGLAVYDGEEDGQDARLNVLRDEVAASFVKLGYTVPGEADPRLWTLDQMLESITGAVRAHVLAVADYRAQQAVRDAAEAAELERQAAEQAAAEAAHWERVSTPQVSTEGAPEVGPDVATGEQGPEGADPGL